MTGPRIAIPVLLWGSLAFATVTITHIPCEGIGAVALRLIEPSTSRYVEGAPVVVVAGTFFTPTGGFPEGAHAADIGAIEIGCLWPGQYDPEYGVNSDGTYDHGGPLCRQALRDALLFATGELADTTGAFIHDLLAHPLTGNVGIYAFSHPGIVATAVLGEYGSALHGVKYFVGRENPTAAAISCVELGHWGPGGAPLFNPYYTYPECYGPSDLTIDYSTVGWIQNATYPAGRPYFAVPGGQDHVLGSQVPTMWGARYYSPQLTQALVSNGALDPWTWPSGLATPQEAAQAWPSRESTSYYPLLGELLPELRVMLVFAEHDHVQVAPDKPHIHQAFDGFREAGLWVRLNPDLAYVRDANPLFDFPEHPANAAPGDWLQIGSWGYPPAPGANHLVPLAALAEMMDRTRDDVWVPDLPGVLHPFTPSWPGVLTFVPSEAAGNAGIGVFVVSPRDGRYSQGAPVVIHIPGGTGGDGIGFSPCPTVPLGFVSMQFNFPGCGVGAAASGGTYDRRGPLSLAALRDVVRFAAGEVQDSQGRFLADLVAPIVPLYDNVGLVGWSNGGNTTICAAGAQGDSMPPLAWIVNWESPVGDGMPTVEAGCVVPGTNPLVNPAYDESTGVFDYTTVAYDPTLPVVAMDGAEIYCGGLYYDVNRNNVVDIGLDYIVRPYSYAGKVYYSVGMTGYAWEHGVIPPSPPAHIPTLEQTQDFWLWRNGANWMNAAVAAHPDLMFLVVASTVDHAQSAANHPHVLTQYNGFIDADARLVRLNPDRAYVESITGAPQPNAVDNDAFAPFSHTTIPSGLEPQDPQGPTTDEYMAASICELADRSHLNVTTPQLEWPLPARDAQITQAKALRVGTPFPNPASASTRLRWWIGHEGRVSLAMYDLAGRMVRPPLRMKMIPGTHEVVWDLGGIPAGVYLMAVGGLGVHAVQPLTVLP